MIDLFAIDPNRYRVYDRAQNLLLTRIIAIAIVGFLFGALIWLLLGLWQHPNAKAMSAIIALASTFALCAVFLAIAIWLTFREHPLVAATLVTSSSLLALVAFQGVWESFWGIDALVLVLFGAYPIVIGSAAVLGNARLSLAMTMLTIGASFFICLLLPLRYDPKFVGASAYGTLVFVIAEQVIIITLIRAAQSLFAKRLQELEEVRLAYAQAKQRLEAQSCHRGLIYEMVSWHAASHAGGIDHGRDGDGAVVQHKRHFSEEVIVGLEPQRHAGCDVDRPSGMSEGKLFDSAATDAVKRAGGDGRILRMADQLELRGRDHDEIAAIGGVIQTVGAPNDKRLLGRLSGRCQRLDGSHRRRSHPRASTC